jgi:opacity protein-like surface antigen
MFQRLLAVAVLIVLAMAATTAADQVKPNDYCYGVMGFEGDGGPIFIIADEKEFKESGAYVGPPASLVPAGFIVNPESDVTFEYRGTIAAGRAALEAAGFKECPEIMP